MTLIVAEYVKFVHSFFFFFFFFFVFVVVFFFFFFFLPNIYFYVTISVLSFYLRFDLFQRR